MQQEGDDVLRVHLAGVIRNERGRVRGADDRDAIVHDRLRPAGSARSSAAFGREVDDHRSRRHRLDHFGRYELRCRASRNQRRRDDDIVAGDDFQHHLALPAVEASSCALAYPPLSSASLDSIGSSTKRAPRLWTCSLTAGRTSYASTLAPSRRARRNRLQTGDAGADDEDAGR